MWKSESDCFGDWASDLKPFHCSQLPNEPKRDELMVSGICLCLRVTINVNTLCNLSLSSGLIRRNSNYLHLSAVEEGDN